MTALALLQSHGPPSAPTQTADKLVILERWTSQELLDRHMEAEHTRSASPVDALVALWAPGVSPTVERFEV